MDLKYIIIIITVLCFLYLIITFNLLIKNSKKIERSKANIDAYLKKRYDLIPNLIEITKTSASYEKGTIERITQLRSEFNQNYSANIIDELNGFYNDIIVLFEKYPELKANENFILIQKQLIEIEDDISALRRILNNNITNYNNIVKKFPSNIIAKVFGYKEYSYPKYQYDNININF